MKSTYKHEHNDNIKDFKIKDLNNYYYIKEHFTKFNSHDAKNYHS